MRKQIMAALLAAAVAAPVAASPAAVDQRYGDDQGNGGYRGDGQANGGYRGDGQGNGGYRGGGQGNGGSRGGPSGDQRWNGDRGRGWDPSQHYYAGRGNPERRLGRGDRIYRGGDGRYYCRRNDGTTGLVLGAIGGGVLGGVIGGDTLGALVGAGGGALLGRAVDRGQVRCR